MNVLMISDVYFPRINGVSTSTATFKQELEQLGHHVTLIAPAYPHTRLPDEADVIRIPSRYLVMDKEDRMMRWRPVMQRLPELRQRRFDVVHVQTPFVAHYLGTRLARRLDVPCVESYHTFFEEYLYHYLPVVPAGWLRFAARRFSSAQCNEVDGLIVPSTAMMDVLRRYGVKTRGEIIPTGLKLDQFAGGDGPAFRRRLGIEPQRPVLVHVGRVAFEKNIDFLLRMLVRVKAAVPEVLLVIAGEGPALGHVKRLARELGLADQVRFVGYLDRKTELLDCYRAGDGFIFASNTETQGLVLLEAMALGVPVVSTAVMGTKDILAPGKGALVAEQREEDFAAKTVQLLRDSALRQRLGGEALDYVKQWTAREMALKLLAYYDEILGRRQAA